jgi:GT2 family glycosyltransferase
VAPAVLQTHFPDDVEVVIVAHDNLATLPATFDSLVRTGCPHDRMTLVDVCSTDGTGDWLARHYPSARLRRLERNDGPSPARNIGIVEARHPRVLLMDADVSLLPDTVRELHDAMQADPAVKIASPIVVHDDRPDLIQYAGGALHYVCEAVNPWRDRPLLERGTDTLAIGAAPTCALLLDRQAAIDVGLFDERYFIGKEDGDFTHRINMAGYTILEIPQARVLHRSRPRDSWLFYYQIRNRWHFILKNYQVRTIVCIAPALLIYEPLQCLLLVAKGHGRTYMRAVRGLVAMLPALRADRAIAQRIRARNDRELLVSGPMVVRDDLAASAMIRLGKRLYESFLDVYWTLLKRLVLTR